MRVRLYIDVSSGWTDGLCGRERAMVSEWAQQAAQKVKRLNDAAQIKAAATIERRNLIEDQAPHLWAELRNKVKTMVEEFNEAFGSQALSFSTSTGRFEVYFASSAMRRTLSVEFAATTAPNALHWNQQGDVSAEGRCSLEVDDGGKVYFAQDVRHESPDSLAKQLLNSLIPQ